MLDKIKELNQENVLLLTDVEITEIVNYIKEADNKLEIITYMIDKICSQNIGEEVTDNVKKLLMSFQDELIEINDNPNKYEPTFVD